MAFIKITSCIQAVFICIHCIQIKEINRLIMCIKDDNSPQMMNTNRTYNFMTESRGSLQMHLRMIARHHMNSLVLSGGNLIICSGRVLPMARIF